MNILPHIRSIHVLILMALSSSGAIHAQQGSTFYLMHQVPQSNLLNPAVQPACKWYLGIPGLVSHHFSLGNSAFTYRELAEGDTWRLHRIADQMHRSDLYGAEAELNLVSLGYRYRSLYFGFNVADRVQLYQTVPGDLARTVLNGNAEFVGETARFGGLRSAFSYSREFAVTLSRVMDPRWTLGIRAGILFGKADLHTGNADLGLQTELYSFNLLFHGDYTMNASLPVTITEDAGGNISQVTLDEIDYVRWLLNRGNPGLNLDLGVIYRYDERTTFSASLLDLGFMRWREDLNNVGLTGSFEFEGVEAGTDVVSFAFLQDLGDSVLNAFNQSVTRDPYTTLTPVQLYLGGSRRLKEHLTVGFVQRNLLLRSKWHRSLTLLGQAEVAERFLFTVSWSAMNNTIANLGAGVAYYGKGVQFHLVSDNILGFFFPFDSRTVNLRAGCNLLFGCPRNRSGGQAESTFGPPPTAGDCSWSGKARNRERSMRKAARKQNKL